MKLYYVAGACSLADHIALIEAGIAHQLVKVERSLAADGKATEDGRDFMAINPKGYVPALELDDGTVLTENLVILAYIADHSGTLLAPRGLARWRALESTAFMTTELHGNFKPLFYPDSTPAEKVKAKANLVRRFETIATQLGDQPFLIGDQMTIADAYLVVMLMWAARFEIPVAGALETYLARMKQAPSVARAIVREGLA